MRLSNFVRLCLLAGALLQALPAAAEFAFRGDAAIRLDEAGGRELREQYRARLRPSFTFDGRWSLQGFVATGYDFGSAYNTAGDEDNGFNVRHLFVRLEDDWGKIELGVIPPYKGRVSSTGLSSEGWIKGGRAVLNRPSGRLEVTLGQLDDLRASQALSAPDDLNYFEIEYSAELPGPWSFELSADRILDDNFARGEIRFVPDGDSAYAAELIYNLSGQGVKTVVSASRDFSVGPQEFEWFGYYAYAGRDFGARAELTEDFLEFGHAIASQVSSNIGSSERFSWFLTVEVYEQSARAQLGVEVSLD